MGGIFIADFGVQDHVKIYRANGTKEDLKNLLRECKIAGAEFTETPELEYVHKNEWTVLLKIRLSTGVVARGNVI
jgi:hypothetical protein